MRESEKNVLASLAAETLGYVPTLFVTIHFRAAQVRIRPQEFLTQFLKRYGDWLRKQTGQPAVFIWVLENPRPHEDATGGGLNAHILVHVPPHLHNKYRKLAQRWLRAAGGTQSRTAVNFRAIDTENFGNCGLSNDLAEKVAYILKGAHPENAEGIERRFGIRIPYRGLGAQGEVIGRRASISNILSRNIRAMRTTSRQGNHTPVLDRLVNKI